MSNADLYAEPARAMTELNEKGVPYTVTLHTNRGYTYKEADVIAHNSEWVFVRTRAGKEWRLPFSAIEAFKINEKG